MDSWMDPHSSKDACSALPGPLLLAPPHRIRAELDCQVAPSRAPPVVREVLELPLLPLGPGLHLLFVVPEPAEGEKGRAAESVGQPVPRQKKNSAKSTSRQGGSRPCKSTHAATRLTSLPSASSGNDDEGSLIFISPSAKKARWVGHASRPSKMCVACGARRGGNGRASAASSSNSSRRR